MQISKWKIISTLLLTILALIFAMPNFRDSENDWLPNDKVNLGLDLRGGSHLLLNVDFDTYIKGATEVLAETIKKSLRDKRIGYKNFHTISNNLRFSLRKQEDLQQIIKLVSAIDSNLSYIENSDQSIEFYYNEYAINQIQDKVIDQSIEIVRMRVDSSGTVEPTIQRQGVDNILLQVPGSKNPAELKRLIGKTAKMSFHLVDENINASIIKDNKVPVGRIYAISEDGRDLVIYKKSIATGDMLKDAQAQFQEGKPNVHFSFNSIGAKKFADATRNNRGKRLAIILDGKILSAPVINEPILTGDGIISGGFNVSSATELALMLRAGALPAPLKVVEERTVGPKLGADSIEAGKIAALVAFALVVVFMLLVYGVLGLIANFTLVIALLYIFAILSILQATLTLPGIAGIILTIGMAVDANVLIYERIREEIAKGNSNLYAVKIGFESAFATIMDSNVTTLIAAFLLYSFGVGAIKGFAVTLTIGILSSMYCALVITKLMIDLWLKYLKPKTLGL